MSIRLLLACAAGLSAATGAGLAAPADPLNPDVPVAPPSHRSAFDGYRRLADPKPTPWRQANDTVERIGGWRTYAREANAPPPDAAASAAAPPTHNAPAGHGGPDKP